MAELLIDWTKVIGIDLVSTHIPEVAFSDPHIGGSLNNSTLAHTWIELSYVAQGGAHNRGLRVVKSWGSAHSNLLREVPLATRASPSASCSMMGLTEVSVVSR